MISCTVACLSFGSYTTAISYQTVIHKSVVIIFGCLFILSVLFTLLKFNEKANMLTTSLYFLGLSQLLKLSVGEQTASPDNTPSKIFQVAYYILLYLLGTLFISLSDETNEDYQEVSNSPRAWEAAPSIEMNTSDSAQITVPGEHKSKEESLLLFRKQTILYHIFLMFMAATSIVLITGWKLDSNTQFETPLSVKSNTGAWIQGVVAILGQVSICWNLIAPRVFPDRTFE